MKQPETPQEWADILAELADDVRCAYESTDTFKGSYRRDDPLEMALGVLCIALSNYSMDRK